MPSGSASPLVPPLTAPRLDGNDGAPNVGAIRVGRVDGNVYASIDVQMSLTDRAQVRIAGSFDQVLERIFSLLDLLSNRGLGLLHKLTERPALIRRHAADQFLG